MPHRTYSEEEVAALFKRAAELQAEGQSSSAGLSHGPGLSLDELTGIAADAGLDPQLLRVAATELDRPGRTRRAVSRATSSEIVAERYLVGALDDDAKEDVVAELRHRFDASATDGMGMGSYGKSTVQTVGRSIEWQHTNPWYGTQTRVLIQPRQEDVRIRVVRNNPYAGSATGWAPWNGPMLALIAGFLAAPAAGSYLVGIAVAVVVLLAATPLLTMLSRRASARHQSEIDHLADEIAHHVQMPSPARPTAAVERRISSMETPDHESSEATHHRTARVKDR